MRRLLILLLLAGFTETAFGASQVARYEFSSAVVSTDTDPTSVAGVFSGVGLGTVPTFNLTSGNPLPSLQASATDIPDGSPPTPAATNTSTGYYTFTVTPAPGITLGYSTLSFDVATLTTDTTNNSFTISLQTGLNNFATLASTTINGSLTSTTFHTVQWDLSSLQQTAAPTDFHLVIQDNTSASNRGILLDNVSLTANVGVMPIPEPSTYVLVGIGLLIGAQRWLRNKFHSYR
jgi:PEP-CTERM motif-containing protein